MTHTENIHVELNTVRRDFKFSALLVDEVLMREKESSQEIWRQIQYGFFVSYNQNLYSIL